MSVWLTGVTVTVTLLPLSDFFIETFDSTWIFILQWNHLPHFQGKAYDRNQIVLAGGTSTVFKELSLCF